MLQKLQPLFIYQIKTQAAVSISAACS